LVLPRFARGLAIGAGQPPATAVRSAGCKTSVPARPT